jgi:hypothetical protein
MRRDHRIAVVLVLCALVGGCTTTPQCRYWSNAPIGRNVLDPSAVPMLPYNPYWVGQGVDGAPADQDACAGEPGHPTPAPPD